MISSASSHEMRMNSRCPFRSDAAHGIQDALGRARVVQVVNDLVAQRSASVRMVGIAAQRDRFTVLHGHNPAARVGAIERTRPADLPNVVRQRGSSLASRREAITHRRSQRQDLDRRLRDQRRGPCQGAPVHFCHRGSPTDSVADAAGRSAERLHPPPFDTRASHLEVLIGRRRAPPRTRVRRRV